MDLYWEAGLRPRLRRERGVVGDGDGADDGLVRGRGARRRDVDVEAVAEAATALTPVPGGLGPVPTSLLLRQVVCAVGEQARDALAA